ncbi:MAG TPA: CarD family transcriptional regulator [Gaiellaceae bacterium]|nr:CarD family transcriptional regulator [Gaiellaceae bacterium]
MRLQVGDVVVYGSHGVGRIAARETRLVSGEEREVVAVELGDGLTVTLPVDRARGLLRAPVTERDVRRVQETLRQSAEVSQEPWLSRQRAALAKLADGDPVGLAEILRDGASRERALLAKGTRTQLSPGERDVFSRAHQLLASEIALVRGVGEDEASRWIDEQLARA